MYSFFANIFALLALLFVVLGLLKREKWNPALCTAIMAAPLAALLLTGAVAAEKGGLLGEAPGNPQESITAFFQDLQAGDNGKANARLIGRGSIDLPETVRNENLNAVLQALRDNLDCDFRGESEKKGWSARQKLTVRYFDVTSWLDSLDETALAALDELVQSRRLEEVFDDKGEYLEGIREEAVANAVKTSLSNPEAYVTEQEVTVRLQRYFRNWRLVANHDLLTVVGGIAPEGNTVSEEIIKTLLQEKTAQVAENLPLIEKIHEIPADALAAPVPDPAAFGVTEDPMVVQAIVEEAADLLNGQTLSWNPDIELMPNSKIQYYYDRSILAIVWKEVHNGSACTYAEVKIAHPSQLRRTICADTWGSAAFEYPTDMARRSNAVVAINGDHYRWRQVGVCVHQGEIMRRDNTMTDTCYFTPEGKMLFSRRQTLNGEELDKFVRDNEINFSLSFGPVLIEDGVQYPAGSYGIGEVYDLYPRACIGWLDDLHYLLMTVNSESWHTERGTIPQCIEYMAEKGCVDAYALDGGQTATMVFNGELANRVNCGGERTMSDIIYFGSAIPEDQR